jgi:hypothetical protein
MPGMKYAEQQDKPVNRGQWYVKATESNTYWGCGTLYQHIGMMKYGIVKTITKKDKLDWFKTTGLKFEDSNFKGMVYPFLKIAAKITTK